MSDTDRNTELKKKFELLSKWVKSGSDNILGKKEDGTTKTIEDVFNDIVKDKSDYNDFYDFLGIRDAGRTLEQWCSGKKEQAKRYYQLIDIMRAKKEELEAAGRDDEGNEDGEGNEGEKYGFTFHRENDDNNNGYPRLVELLIETWDEARIPHSEGFAPKDHEYPYDFFLGKKDETLEESQYNAGGVTLDRDDHLIMKSDELSHFTSVMTALKKDNVTSITLDLPGSNTDKKKKFAAKALIAAELNGIEIKDLPFSIDELAQVDHRVKLIKNLRENKEKTSKAARKFEENQTDENKTALGNAIAETFNTYTEIAKDTIPPIHKMTIFKSGAKAAKHAKTRALVDQAIQAQQGQNGN